MSNIQNDSHFLCLASLDPIWTVKTGSLFLLKLTVEELFTSNGLICEAMDFDKFGGNDKLGLITIPPKVLFEAKGERLEYDLRPSKGSMPPSVSSFRTFFVCIMDECGVTDFVTVCRLRREVLLFAVAAPLTTTFSS